MAKKESQQNLSLEQALLRVSDQAAVKQSLTIEELLKLLAKRGYPITLILLSLPFCQPIQIPGFSTPFGIMIAFIGLRMAFGHRLWWPQWILKRPVSTKLLQKVIKKSLWLVKKLQSILHTRWTWLCSPPFSPIIHGVAIAIFGLFLALPLPIPLSNLAAAWAVLLVAFGLLEDDGLFIFLGYIIAALSLIIMMLIIASIKYLASL